MKMKLIMERLREEGLHIHGDSGEGWCYITAKNGRRFRLDEGFTYEDVTKKIAIVKRINENYFDITK